MIENKKPTWTFRWAE